LARAIYSERPIIILDEATNALDMMTEKAIFSKIASMSGKTLFVITHRLELLNLFDKIAYINSQKSIISGSLDELLSNNSEFECFVTSTKNVK
jgi:ABC-type bacteriocin/lantibiotic exporter with double-glycine peptidase domain